MPTYEYECESCKHRFEVFQKITEDPITKCEKCEGKVHRVMFPVGVMFKGAGFHVNDYPSSGNTSASGSASSTSETSTSSSNS